MQILRNVLIGLIVTLVLGAALAPPVQATEPSAPPALVEAEWMRVLSGSSVVADAEASGGLAVKVARDGAPFGLFPLPAGVAVSMRLRGDQCDGAPAASLELDGVTLGTVGVSSTGWREYQVEGAVSEGHRWVAVRFANQRVTASCARALYIDWVRVDGEVLPPAEPTVEVNTGTAGSVCQATDGGLVASPPGEGVQAGVLHAAPAYHEIGAPTGAFAGTEPRGIMLLVHGGGWFTVGPGAAATNRAAADSWRALGWETWNVSHRACDRSLDDVLWFYDQARSGRADARMCASGSSSGGHLVMMLSVLRADVDCVITSGAVLDLTALASDRAHDPASGGTQSAGPVKVHHWARAAFGEERFTELSPMHHVGEVAADVLVAIAERDIFVSGDQATAFVGLHSTEHPGRISQAMVLEGGSQPWVHGGVSAAALVDFDAAAVVVAGAGNGL